jgi:hypothetical protein
MNDMRAFIIVATKGRAKEVRGLLDILQSQTLAPTYTLVIGTEAQDIQGLAGHLLFAGEHGEAFISPRIGATCQRNVGLDTLRQRGYFNEAEENYFCVFFDDDFRPHANWLQEAAKRFAKGDIIGLTGRVLADGIGVGGYNEDQAAAFLKGELLPREHWANTTSEQETDCAYGCNMAFIGRAARQIRFDENLPLYSWQEDRDYTGQCLKLGRVVRIPSCIGVHMGTSSGRTSGLRFGYSQIANPYYLMKKGTMSIKAGIEHMARNFVANIIKSILPLGHNIDYPGRLRGNLRSIIDMLRGRSDPRRILNKDF